MYERPMVQLDNGINASAFLVNDLRAMREDLCLDPYAKLWISDLTKPITQEWMDTVCNFDSIVLSLRNRFFLAQAEAISHLQNALFVNLGAGYTHYAWLVGNPIDTIEVDLPVNTEFKQKWIRVWEKEGKIPKRPVRFVCTDLRDPQQRSSLIELLKKESHGRNVLVVMEGLTYYLEKPIVTELFAQFTQFDALSTTVAFDYWAPEEATNPTLQKAQHFLTHRIGYRGEYNYWSDEELKALEGYQPALLSDVLAEQKRLCPKEPLQWKDIIPERFAALRQVATSKRY